MHADQARHHRAPPQIQPQRVGGRLPGDLAVDQVERLILAGGGAGPVDHANVLEHHGLGVDPDVGLQRRIDRQQEGKEHVFSRV